ncbi:hypothetical protein WSM22_42840 [Cytophagales bacterium WSM2-2]|nr:hypothetical protein WSM22_42840 [Cytophagales bacterium WSM2-2]
MTKALTYLIVCVCALTGCTTQRAICPAYQSAFIFDKPTERSTFVHFNENKNQPQEVLASNSKTLNLPARDSSWDKSVVMPGPALPFERRVKKDRYLLLPKKTYKKALRSLQTVSMKRVYPKKEETVDSLAIKQALDSAARSVTDTITTTASAKKKTKGQEEDSVYVISKEKEKFNLDQDAYMWYFRDVLVLPDVKLGIEGAKADKEAATTKGGAKLGFFAKLKNLFKKKPKKTVVTDTTGVNANIQQEENYDTGLDSTVVQQPQPEVQQQPQTKKKTQPSTVEKKKGVGLFKRKPKTQTAPPPKKQDAKKKDEGDGF